GVAGRGGEGELQAHELGAATVALVLEPVRVDAAVVVGVGVRRDGVEQAAFFVAHGVPFALRTHAPPRRYASASASPTTSANRACMSNSVHSCATSLRSCTASRMMIGRS